MAPTCLLIFTSANKESMQKNLKLNSEAVKNLLQRLSKNLSLLFLTLFLLLVIFEILEIQKSFNIVSNFRQEPQVVMNNSGVRINFEGYDKVVKRIQDSQIYQPPGGVEINPFSNGQ